MDLEDLFQHKNKYKKKQYSHQTPYEYRRKQFDYSTIFSKINENKTLRNVLIMGVLLVIVIVVTLLIVLFPLIMKLINYISENGIEGALNVILDFLNKLWSGSK